MTLTVDRAPEQQDPERAPHRWRRIGWITLAVWLVGLVAWTARYGIPVDRSIVLLWVAGGLLAASIGRRSVWTVLLDWLPFALVLVFYDFARHASVAISGFAVWTPQVHIDRLLGGGVNPTVWLQSELREPTPPWWELIVSVCYASYFVMPYVTAAVLWLRSRTEFRRWAARFVAVSLLGVVCFTLMPSAPPWAAALCTRQDVASLPPDPGCMHADPTASMAIGGGLLGPVQPIHDPTAPYLERLVGRGWSVIDLHPAEAAIYKGQSIANLVAAIPSLHEASVLLFTFFFWRRVRRSVRILLALYPVLMAFSLVYSGEHYVTDILAAVVLVSLVQWVAGRVERWLGRKRSLSADTLGTRPVDPTQEPREAQCPPIATTPSSI